MHWDLQWDRLTGLWICKNNCRVSCSIAHQICSCSLAGVNGVVKGKIYRKPWFLPSNIGVSCKFSHHPILWWLKNILKNMSSSAGKDDIPCMKWKIIHMFETTNQVLVLHSNAHDFELQTHWHFVVLKSDCIGVDAMLNDNNHHSNLVAAVSILHWTGRVGDLVFAQTSQLHSATLWSFECLPTAFFFFRRGPFTSMVIYPLKIHGDFPVFLVHPIEPRVLKSPFLLWSNHDPMA